MFERIDVENSGPKSSSGRERGAGPAGAKRQKKDAKFGFGGKKRFSKSGDAQSSADLSGFSSERMKGRGGGRGGRGGSKRLGKNRRAAAR
jgi:rRNA-processing protein EBP2